MRIVRGDWMGWSFGWNRKTEVPCHSWWGTTKIPPCLKALSSEHLFIGLNFAALHRQWWRLHISETFLQERYVRPQALVSVIKFDTCIFRMIQNHTSLRMSVFWVPREYAMQMCLLLLSSTINYLQSHIWHQCSHRLVSPKTATNHSFIAIFTHSHHETCWNSSGQNTCAICDWLKISKFPNKYVERM
jgi:hypothetical protein